MASSCQEYLCRIVLIYVCDDMSCERLPAMCPTSWRVRGSNPGGGEVFRIRPDRPWGPPSLLYNGYRVSFQREKRWKRGVNHPLPSSAEVKETIELYLYSTSEPSSHFEGRTIPFAGCVCHVRYTLRKQTKLSVENVCFPVTEY